MSAAVKSKPKARPIVHHGATQQRTFATPEAVVIGVSAGGLKALTAILPVLPADYPLPIMIVIHLPPDRDSVVADLFNEKCALTVREAEDKEDILPGHAYFAPPDYHLLIEADGRLSLSSEEPVLFSRPSVDVLFESAADVYGAGLIGIVLTGANPDGAMGLKAILDAGGRGLVQRPDLSYASAMPEAALTLSPSAEAMTLEQIAETLQKAVTV